MKTKDIIKALIYASYNAAYNDNYTVNGSIIEWYESDTNASLAVEFGTEVFEVEITVRKR